MTLRTPSSIFFSRNVPAAILDERIGWLWHYHEPWIWKRLHVMVGTSTVLGASTTLHWTSQNMAETSKKVLATCGFEDVASILCWLSMWWCPIRSIPLGVADHESLEITWGILWASPQVQSPNHIVGFIFHCIISYYIRSQTAYPVVGFICHVISSIIFLYLLAELWTEFSPLHSGTFGYPTHLGMKNFTCLF